LTPMLNQGKRTFKTIIFSH